MSANCPPDEALSTIFEQESGEYAWSMSRGLTFRHHEVHRTKLHIHNVMRQTRTSNDNAFEHTLDDYWNDERERSRALRDWNSSFPNVEG